MKHLHANIHICLVIILYKKLDLDIYDPENSCPLKFWKKYQHLLPTLAKLGKKYLTPPITSCPSERLFKKAKVVKAERELLGELEFEIETLLSKNLSAFQKKKWI
jgi:hypothetical protein